MRPTLDLRAQVRSNAIKLFVLSCVGVVVGLIALVLGAMTGFLLCIAIPLVIGAPIAAVMALVFLVFPELRFSHLGIGEQRRAVMGEIEREANDPRAYFAPLRGGRVWITPSWIVLFAGDEVVVVHKRDVMHVYVLVERRRYGRESSFVKVRTRRTDYKCPVDVQERDWLVGTIASAAPWAAVGYDPRWLALRREQLAFEIDQRAASMLPR
jgi:hypothetical protein